jgi:uncharacterized tellurite resistance protein B-like protein
MIDHKKIASDWSKSHFLLYLYLCEISADEKLEESEIDDILDKYEALDIADENYVDTFNDVLIEYKAQDKSDIVECIKQYIPEYFSTPTERRKLVENLKELALSDSEMNDEEGKIIQMVQDLFI